MSEVIDTNKINDQLETLEGLAQAANEHTTRHNEILKLAEDKLKAMKLQVGAFVQTHDYLFSFTKGENGWGLYIADGSYETPALGAIAIIRYYAVKALPHLLDKLTQEIRKRIETYNDVD